MRRGNQGPLGPAANSAEKVQLVSTRKIAAIAIAIGPIAGPIGSIGVEKGGEIGSASHCPLMHGVDALFGLLEPLFHVFYMGCM